MTRKEILAQLREGYLGGYEAAAACLYPDLAEIKAPRACALDLLKLGHAIGYKAAWDPTRKRSHTDEELLAEAKVLHRETKAKQGDLAERFAYSDFFLDGAELRPLIVQLRRFMTQERIKWDPCDFNGASQIVRKAVALKGVQG